MNAYHSEKMARFSGTVVWRRENGEEVECTAVSAPPHSLYWDDVKDLGPVSSYVRPGSRRGVLNDTWMPLL